MILLVSDVYQTSESSRDLLRVAKPYLTVRGHSEKRRTAITGWACFLVFFLQQQQHPSEVLLPLSRKQTPLPRESLRSIQPSVRPPSLSPPLASDGATSLLAHPRCCGVPREEKRILESYLDVELTS